MAEAINETYRAYNFVLKIQDQDAGYFTEVSGLNVEIETIEYREGGAGPAVRKLPGRVKYGDVTLKWGLTENRELTDWLKAIAQGDIQRKDISVILRKPNGVEEATRWNLRNAWPCSWRGASLDASENEVAIETMVITHEGLERA
ncbi:MAG: phage tail protein [Gammaproteobacteria bacterium]|nr:phage tail protein [Chromatiales bacterium]MDX5375611.1 phage tail protein [Gammaproteobacteria bacterium]